MHCYEYYLYGKLLWTLHIIYHLSPTLLIGIHTTAVCFRHCYIPVI